MNERIGYDELIESRVNQLKEIDRQVEAIEGNIKIQPDKASEYFRRLRLEIADMIQTAEDESKAF